MLSYIYISRAKLFSQQMLKCAVVLAYIVVVVVMILSSVDFSCEDESELNCIVETNITLNVISE